MTEQTKKYIADNEELMDEWDYEANKDLNPKEITIGSGKKVWWKCHNGHKYAQTIHKRTLRGYSCPYCSGHKAWKGFNDFATRYPDVAKEWHPTKNGHLKPTDVTYGSGKKVWWICSIGHEYQASIHDRGLGQTKCPICNSQRLTSFGEQAIFYYIKKSFPDALNRYNELFSTSMELDIYIPSLKYAIEYDGAHWHQTDDEYKRELKKYRFCKNNGIFLCRVKEKSQKKWEDVGDKIYYLKKVKRTDFSELEQVICYILHDINSALPIDINIIRDKNEIQGYLYEIKHSLSEERSDVAKKWNYEKNKNLTPNMFSIGSNEIVWWKCPNCGHEWKSSINSMTREGRQGCSVCSRSKRGEAFTKSKVKKVGSLAETMPELAKEWHPTKNGDMTPYNITAGRFKSVWWLCQKCGYEWQASPNNRKKGVGCPCCSGRVPQKGINDLATKYPDVIKDWDYEKNSPLIPEQFLPGSGKKLWWKCSFCNHSWKIEIRRKVKGAICPCCHNQNELQLKLF